MLISFLYTGPLPCSSSTSDSSSCLPSGLLVFLRRIGMSTGYPLCYPSITRVCLRAGCVNTPALVVQHAKYPALGLKLWVAAGHVPAGTCLGYCTSASACFTTPSGAPFGTLLGCLYSVASTCSSPVDNLSQVRRFSSGLPQLVLQISNLLILGFYVPAACVKILPS